MPFVRLTRLVTLVALVYLLALTAGAHTARAQERDIGRDFPFHSLSLTTGGAFMSVSALNSALAQGQFAGLSTDGITYGATGYISLHRTMIGFDVGETTFGEEGLNNGHTGDLSTIHVLLTGSYALISTGRLALFPSVGMGLGRVNVNLRDRNGGNGTSTGAPSFAEVVMNPGVTSNLTGAHLLLSVGGGGDYLILQSRRDDFGVVFGARVGYLVAPTRTSWSRNDVSVGGGPSTSAGGPFLRIAVGIGGR